MLLTSPSNYKFLHIFLLLPWLLSTQSAGAQTLQEQATAMDQPTIGPRIDMEGPIQLHQSKIEPAAGTTVYQLMAGNWPCGLYIAGPARFTYRVEDRFSVPVAERNIERASKLTANTADDGLEIVEQIKEAVVWSLDIGSSPGQEAAASPSFPGWAEELLARPLFSRPSVNLLSSAGEGSKGAVYALLDGQSDFLRILRDPTGSGTESLHRIEKTDTNHPVFKKRHFVQRLATSPTERQWWDRFPAALVATHENIRVENTDGEAVKVTTTTDLQATKNDVGIWVVNLVSDIAFTTKETLVEVTSVTAGGQALDYLHKDDRLLVALPKVLAQGEKVKVTVVHEGDLAHRAGGDNFWSLGTWAWYPQPNLNGELATVDLSLSVPKGFTPFASGEIVSRREEGDRAIIETRLENPMQFPVVAAGKYKVFSDTHDGITCNVATYGGGKEKGAKRLIRNFFAAAEYYKNLFDIPYPFKEFTIVEVNTWGFGQAPPGLIFITKEAFNSTASNVARFFSDGLNERYVHEVAHAWWGHVVKMDSPEEQWITESFASYSAALCLEVLYGGKKGEKTFRRIIKNWHGQSTGIRKGGSVYLANYLAGEGFQDGWDRTSLLYEKGPVVIHAIREKLNRDMGSEKEGFRAFVAFLRTYLKSFRYQWAPTRHMVDILNQITGKGDWQPWFEKYIYGTALPGLELVAKK